MSDGGDGGDGGSGGDGSDGAGGDGGDSGQDGDSGDDSSTADNSDAPEGPGPNSIGDFGFSTFTTAPDPDGTSAPSGFAGMNAVANSDPANDKGKDAPGYSAQSDASSFFSTAPQQLQTQQVSPSVLSGLRGLAKQDTEEKSAVLSVAMGLMTAAMPAVSVLSTLTDIARALGLSEEAPSFGDPSEGGEAAGGGPAGGPATGADSFMGSVTVNPPVFLTVGSSSLPAAASSFTTPLGATADSGNGSAAPADQGEEAPLWPLIAAAAALALAAA